jgi:hypothetical protein
VAPIEILFGVLVFVFALIGLVRGFLRELGVTLPLMFLLYFLTRFEPLLTTGLARAMNIGQRVVTMRTENELKAWIYLFIIIGSTFVAYEGETLAFAGQPLRGAQGFIMGLLTGTLNGYLVAGTIWFYLDRFGYPIGLLGLRPELSPVAQGMIRFLPITFLGGPVIFGQSLLLYLTGLLFLARVIR